LSEVWLTRNALRELDRRNQQSTPSALSEAQPLIPLSLQKFARQGGPGLSDLRGVRISDHQRTVSRLTIIVSRA
jgi:phage-related protein